jgi:hypothetical protein
MKWGKAQKTGAESALLDDETETVCASGERISFSLFLQHFVVKGLSERV